MLWPSKQLGEQKYFDEIVAMWLKDEWHYPFYDEKRKTVSERIIQDPDLSNPQENNKRLELLMSNRGHMIEKLPKDTKWHLVDFKKEDIDRTFLIPMRKGWVSKITNKSCKLKDALNENSLSLLEKEDADRIRTIRSLLGRQNINSRLIFLSSSTKSPFTCLEGNHRLIAMAANALKDKNIDTIIKEAYLGISPEMKGCDLCAEKYFF